MFRSLDALIGFATVMLVLSLVVTVLTQIVANLLKLRTRHLRDGVLEVFLQLGWEFAGERAKALAHEIVGGKDAITREDLIEKLLALAQKTPELKTKIAALVSAFDPPALLAHLRRVSLELSVERPDLAAAAVRSAAMARTPTSGLASEVFGVFDSTMDQVSEKFACQSRKLVAFFGIALALALPLDAFDLLQRFSRSDAARDQAVALAQTLAANEPDVRVAIAKLQAAEIIVIPLTPAEWLARWQKVNGVGVTASVLLLTLGAPFWFHVLKDLLKLRSAVAGQESQDRAQRQASLTDSPPPRAENEAPYERNPQAVLAKKLHARTPRRPTSVGDRDSHLGRNAGLGRRLVWERRRAGLRPLLRRPRRRSAPICERRGHRVSRRQPRESHLAPAPSARESQFLYGRYRARRPRSG